MTALPRLSRVGSWAQDSTLPPPVAGFALAALSKLPADAALSITTVDPEQGVSLVLHQWANQYCGGVDEERAPQTLHFEKDNTLVAIYYDVHGEGTCSLDRVTTALESKKAGAGWLFMDVLALLDGYKSFLEILTPLSVWDMCVGYAWGGSTTNEELLDYYDDDCEIERGPDQLMESMPAYLARYVRSRHHARTKTAATIRRRLKRFYQAIDEAFPGMSAQLDEICMNQIEIEEHFNYIDSLIGSLRRRFEPNFVWLWSDTDQFEHFYDEVHQLRLSGDSEDGSTIVAPLYDDVDHAAILAAIEITSRLVANVQRLMDICERQS